MPGASASGGYAANAGNTAASMAARAGNVSSNISYGIGSGTAAGSAAASGYPLANYGSGFSTTNILMALQGISGIVGSISSAKASSSAADFNASIYDSNARIMAIRAAHAIQRGDKEAVRAKQLARRIIGSQRAAMGAQGIDLESGSALDIQKETASLGAEEAMIIKNNSWLEAWGYRVAENDLYGQAKYARITGKNTARNTILTGGLTALKSFAYGSYLDKSRSFYGQGNSGLFGEE